MPSCVIAMRDSLFCKCFCHYSALSKKRRWKCIRRNCVKQDKEKKKKQGWKIALGHKKCLKLAQILQQSSGTRQVCVSVFFFSDHCIKQIDSMLPWVCSVTNHWERQNVVKTSVTHSPAARVPLLHVFTTFHVTTWQLNDVMGILFSLLCSTWRVLLRIFVRLFRIK